MKSLILITVCGLLLAGCAQEAIYIDHEHGMASMDAYDRMIVHKDYKYAGQDVEGLPGLDAEPIMGTFHGTYSESFTSEAIDITDTGSED